MVMFRICFFFFFFLSSSTSFRLREKLALWHGPTCTRLVVSRSRKSIAADGSGRLGRRRKDRHGRDLVRKRGGGGPSTGTWSSCEAQDRLRLHAQQASNSLDRIPGRPGPRFAAIGFSVSRAKQGRLARTPIRKDARLRMRRCAGSPGPAGGLPCGHHVVRRRHRPGRPDNQWRQHSDSFRSSCGRR